MNPPASSENARRTMRANGRVSGRELELRRVLWRIGCRGYRVRTRLPGRPDLIYGNGRVAVFVHGCFWHRCPTCDPALPRANRDFWRQKFAANAARDDRAVRALADLGWQPIVVWEHELKTDPKAAALRVTAAVNRRRDGTAKRRRGEGAELRPASR